MWRVWERCLVDKGRLSGWCGWLSVGCEEAVWWVWEGSHEIVVRPFGDVARLSGGCGEVVW